MLTSCCAASFCLITTRVRGETAEADGLTIRRSFLLTIGSISGSDGNAFAEEITGSTTARGEDEVVICRRAHNNQSVKIAVCVKQIPDPADPGNFDEQTKTLNRSSKLILDESDSYGVEMALQLTEADEESSVVLLSMAPDGEVGGIRNALAMGADEAVVVSDEALAGSDALVTAKVLAAALRRLNPDLVLTATESTDGYTGTVPAQIAELLDMPSLTFVKSVELTEESGSSVLRVQRQTEIGYDEVLCPLPAVVSLTAGVVEPRYPSFRGIMAAKSKPTEHLTLADLGIDASEAGWSGARQEITEIAPVPERGGGEIHEDEGNGHERILAFLEELKVL